MVEGNVDGLVAVSLTFSWIKLFDIWCNAWFDFIDESYQCSVICVDVEVCKYLLTSICVHSNVGVSV